MQVFLLHIILTDTPLENSLLCLIFTRKGCGEKEGKGKVRENLVLSVAALCSKALVMSSVCLTGYRFREEKEQFVLFWLYKNTLDSVLLTSDYNSHPRIRMEENKKASVKHFFFFFSLICLSWNLETFF